MNGRRTARTTLRTNDLWLMLALVACAGTVLILWSHLGDELIPVNDGTGYDGSVYAMITRDPWQAIVGDGLDIHRLQRVVPSLFVFLVLGPWGLHTSTAAVILGFQVLDYALIGLASVLWWQIARRLDLSSVAGWVGFSAMFVNYGFLKFPSYYPVLTDTSGFFLGMLLVWCFVTRRHGLMPWVAVVGAFTWPTVTYSALMLYVLSRPTGAPRPSRWWGVVSAAVLAAGVTVGALYVYRCGDGCATGIMINGVLPTVLPISLVLLAVWVFLASWPLLELVTVPNVLRAVHWRRLLVAATVMFLVVLVQRQLADASQNTVSRTLFNTVLGGVAKPAGFLVAHAIYFGPAILLLALTWRRTVRAISVHGVGLPALLLVYVLLGISSESRILANQWPFFVLLTAVIVDRLGWVRWHLAVFAATALAMSRVWFPVTQGELTGHIHTYPDQFYGMSIGLRMTVTSYLLMGALTIAGGLVTIWLVRRSPCSALRQ